MKNTIAFVALASCLAIDVEAASPPAVPQNLLACSDLQDATERVRCYDAQIAALKQQSQPNSRPTPRTQVTAPAPVPVLVAPPPPSAPRPAAQFGSELVERPERPAADSPEAALKATVTVLRQQVPNEYVVTLDNGQVWRQQDPKANFKLQIGDAVSIRRGAVGSYRLSRDLDGTKNWIRVTRLK